MTDTVEVRTARKQHYCATCNWHTADGEPGAIQPGHRYLIHVAFPGTPGYEEGTRPARLKECVACAEAREYAGALDSGACRAWCCGTTPCALPSERGAPGHEHSCRECAANRAGMGVSA